MNRPPSGRRSNNATKLLYKEQEFKELNAALEEKTASLITEAELVLRGQDTLFGDVDATGGEINQSDISTSHRMSTSAYSTLGDTDAPIFSIQPEPATKAVKGKGKVQSKQRPQSGPTLPNKKVENVIKKKRPQSTKPTTRNKLLASPINLIEERATLADRINTLELEAADDVYTPTGMNDDVLPDVANDIGSDATIRFLKAKLRVMQEELDNIAVECREKASIISKLKNTIKEKEEIESSLVKKNENLQSIIEKHKSSQGDVRSKNSHLESEIAFLRKEVDKFKREKKQNSANKNTLEVRLNRALEDVQKHKSALQKSKESSKATNETDHKRLEQLQHENKRLEKQKNELLTAFKKQLKLIDILKRQKMHIEAAKMLEFSEEEFIRALDWGK